MSKILSKKTIIVVLLDNKWLL